MTASIQVEVPDTPPVICPDAARTLLQMLIAHVSEEEAANNGDLGDGAANSERLI